MAELQITSADRNGMPVVSLVGELDNYSSPRVRTLLTELLVPESPTVILDLSQLEYIDSAGLGVLVGGLKIASSCSGTVALVNPSPAIVHVLKVTGLDRIFQLFDDEDVAERELKVL
jgi:anti-sigma B factor antagonist